MHIIYSKILPPKGYKAMAILNFIVVKKGCIMKQVDITHEEIHWQQEKELLIIGFYLLYILFFLFYLIKYCNWKKAYRHIPFEMEAYAYEEDYSSRKHYGWTKFIS